MSASLLDEKVTNVTIYHYRIATNGKNGALTTHITFRNGRMSDVDYPRVADFADRNQFWTALAAIDAKVKELESRYATGASNQKPATSN